MKYIKRILSFLSIVLVISLIAVVNQHSTNYVAQNASTSVKNTDLKRAIQESFQKGEVAVLYPHFDELISICIDDIEEIYLAYNAQTALQNFFITHPPSQFKVMHTGQNKSGSRTYFIGDYEDVQQEKFRVYLLTAKELIQEIEISKKQMDL